MTQASVVDTHVHTSKLGPGKLKHLLHLALDIATSLPLSQLRQRLNERESRR